MAKKVVKKVAKKVTKKPAKKVAKKAAPKKSVTKKAAPKKTTKKVAKKAAPKKQSAGVIKSGLPEIGSPAPGFTLKDQNGKDVSLSDFKGKNVVVYFYPKAMTPGCTVQACSLRDAKAELADAGIVVLGISIDPVARLKKFEDRDKLNFTLLSDEDHHVADLYGSWGRKKFMGREFDGVLRQSFLIDKKGNILHIMHKVDTKTHHDDVLNLFKRLG